jgi:hypothetical protein
MIARLPEKDTNINYMKPVNKNGNTITIQKIHAKIVGLK